MEAALSSGAIAALALLLEAEAGAAKLSASKALLNLTQGSSKEDPAVVESIQPLLRCSLSARVRGGDAALQRYCLMALANLSNGSDALKEKLVQLGVAQVVGGILGAQEVDLLLATQALRVVMPLSTSPFKAELVRATAVVEALNGILKAPMQRLSLKTPQTPADKAVAAQVYKVTQPAERTPIH